MSKKQRSHRNDLGSLFAASVVLTLGAAICAILYLTGSPQLSVWRIAAIICIPVTMLAALIGVRFPKPGTGLTFWNAMFTSRSGRDEPAAYEPRRMETGPSGPPVQPRPATAEEVREIHALSANTWVPSRDRLRRTKHVDELES